VSDPSYSQLLSKIIWSVLNSLIDLFSRTELTNDYPVQESATSFKNMSGKHEANGRFRIEQ